jgi:hypothetical protein
VKGLRIARAAVWILATAIAIWQHFDLDHPIVTVVTILIAALALDRVLELAERQLAER